ncbi:PREDICTED: pre-rRNA-processing protein ESF2 isoform X2 [Tarenaya hassleriana]|uniref:pre-rRNA-processing protein ESF2 isoform X2 n=1 Tax=Tarenaya hassleriana TaxID=28532 RepID=UPI00053C8433|nr:PREDICTED: pre-rRNA-processing protein ESF2 isoform X2 [Tarenaya hassleriana]
MEDGQALELENKRNFERLEKKMKTHKDLKKKKKKKAKDLCEIQIGDGISGGNSVEEEGTEPCDSRATAEGDGGGAGIENLVSETQKAERNKKKKKERLLREAAKADNRGVCYLSRIPPHMDHVRLRHLLSQYGEIGRIYLAPEDPEAQLHRKRAGGFRGQLFSEGWVEFTKKSVGGRKRSSVFYDIWNIKYLSKFKWDDLTEEIAYKSAIREQKLNMVLSAAKRERDFYLSKVEKSRAMNAIEERMKKKQKIHAESGENAETAPVIQPKTIRNFRQKKPVKDETHQIKPKLSSDVLAGIFSGS